MNNFVIYHIKNELCIMVFAKTQPKLELAKTYYEIIPYL